MVATLVDTPYEPARLPNLASYTKHRYSETEGSKDNVGKYCANFYILPAMDFFLKKIPTDFFSLEENKSNGPYTH